MIRVIPITGVKINTPWWREPPVTKLGPFDYIIGEPMKIDWSKPLETTSGLKATYLGTRKSENDFVFMVLVDHGLNERFAYFNDLGYGVGLVEDCYTIRNVPPPKAQKTIWLSLWGDHTCYVSMDAPSRRSGLIACKQITIVEGEGMGDP